MAQRVLLPPNRGERPWLDGEDAHSRIAACIHPELRRCAEEVWRDGYTTLPELVPEALCDRAMSEFYAYCRTHADEAARFADQHELHSRLGNLHMESTALREIAFEPRLLRLLDFLFGYRAAVYTSLTFEKGTQQSIHRDAPFFHTDPPGFFFGVWTALEDVRLDAGPLVYYRGGHRVEGIDTAAIGQRFKNEPDRADPMFGEYCRQIEERCQAQGLPLEAARLKKGDTLIWHALLPHSGRKIERAGATRKSVVFHYAPEGIPMHGPEVFFGVAPVPAPRVPDYKTYCGRLYYDHKQPVFHHNY